MMKYFAATAALLALMQGSLCADDPIFDVKALSSTPLNPRVISAVEKKGIVTETVRFHSETDGRQDVDIFAFFSYPKGARNLPAFIWNQGGLSQASPGATSKPAARGYAVMCIDFPQPTYRSTGDYPINSGLHVGPDPHKAPIYHGVVALLKAVSYLETRPEVDRDRIGIAGASWGGFFSTLMVGIDPRLKVGSCLYGCGSLQLGNAWWDGVSRSSAVPVGPAERERWRTTLDPAWRLPTKTTPIGWFTGTNDAFYSMPALMKSYQMAAGEKHLTLVPNWDHALSRQQGEEQVLGWLDTILKGRRVFPTVAPVRVENEGGRLIARWSFDGNGATADLIASYGEPGNWRGRYWHTFTAHIHGKTCQAELPASRLPCFVSGSVTSGEGYRSSTPLLRVDAAALGVKASTLVPDFDGCEKWGAFEEDAIAYLSIHTRGGQRRWFPNLSADAREGKHSAILGAGEIVLPPILCTANVPSRFSCYFKAVRPVDVTVKLGDKMKTFQVSTTWTKIEMDFTPPNPLMGVFPASLSSSGGANVLVDAISFHPLPITGP
ncbi:MAG TPA: hypothetical protein VMR25_23370 [Planctomycetaceae bacterium]|jgi:dienelactone hydrolase|nr:hypothetical protein [Planctomycetaceae bacterium]